MENQNKPVLLVYQGEFFNECLKTNGKALRRGTRKVWGLFFPPALGTTVAVGLMNLSIEINFAKGVKWSSNLLSSSNYSLMSLDVLGKDFV